MGTPLDFAKVQTYVDNVLIRGLQTSNEEYVKKQMGELFKSTNFNDLLTNTDKFRKNLLKLGCFKKVETLIDASDNKIPNSYQVIVDVEEVNRIGGSIQSQIGNNEGSISSSIYFPNIFGKGEKLSAEYTYGTRNFKDFRLNYNGHIDMDPNKTFSVSLFRSQNDFIWSKYKENNTGVMIDVLTPFSHLIRNKYMIEGTHTITYEGTWRHLLTSLDSSFDVREQSGHSLKSSFKYENTVDRRDHRVLPNRGGLLKTTIEAAGFGGDVRFFRYNSDYQYTKTILKYFTTQFTCSEGFIIPLKTNEKILINDRYFLGGPLNLRGFSNRGAGPHKDDCSLGNDMYWLLGAHLYTPLPFLHKNEKLSSFLKTHSFINIGNIGSIAQLTSAENKFDYVVKNARLSVGTGLVLAFGNMARVELNYVWPVWKQPTDKAINGLQFGIGIIFN